MRDVGQGVPLDKFNSKAEKMRREERTAELKKLKKGREQRAQEKAQREEEQSLIAREWAWAEAEDFEKKEPLEIHTAKTPRKLEFGTNEEDNLDETEEGEVGSFSPQLLQASEYEEAIDPRKPKYSNQIHTGYVWNKYNRTHYDHNSPPPKFVQGYKFNIFYPDLVDKTKTPIYSFDKDGDSTETCVIRFHAGPPYDDIAFRIVNEEWEFSIKKGFKCEFERGTLKLHFNFKRFVWRK